MLVGGVLAALGALNWIYALFWGPGSSYCSGNGCYQTIGQPIPWYSWAVLPVGLVLLFVGVLPLVRGGRERAAT